MPRKTIAAAAPITRVALKKPAKNVAVQGAGALTRQDLLAVVGEALAAHPALQRTDLQVVGSVDSTTQYGLKLSEPKATGPSAHVPPTTPLAAIIDQTHDDLSKLNADLDMLQSTLRPHLQNGVFEENEAVCRDQTYRTYGSDLSPTQIAFHMFLNQIESMRERVAFITRNIVI